VSVSSRPDAPDQPHTDPHATDASATGAGPTNEPTGELDLRAVDEAAAADGDPARRRRVTKGLVAGGLVLVLAGGAFAVQQVRAADAENAAAEQRSAEAELAADLGQVRETVAAPARDGQNTASALLRHQLSSIAGEGPDAEVGDQLVADLREAADELEAAAGTPLPERPEILPVATVDPIYERLAGLEDQASDLAVTYREAADETEEALVAVRDLEAAAIEYSDTDDLTSSDDPDTVAASWQAEGDRLDAYQDAIDAAAEQPLAAPLADAHQQLVDGLRQLSTDALERLGADDIDGYNALLDERLGDEDPFGFTAALEEARAEVADAAIDGPLTDARERGFGLLTELEELRRTTPAQLAEVP
jgi:hypothetical protein